MAVSLTFSSVLILMSSLSSHLRAASLLISCSCGRTGDKVNREVALSTPYLPNIPLSQCDENYIMYIVKINHGDACVLERFP